MINLCPQCGAAISPQARFCKTCGANQPSQALVPAQPKISHSPPAPTILAPSAANPAVISGGGEIVLSNGLRYPLNSPTTIGRDDTQCDLILPQDGQVSRQHAQLIDINGQWEIRDLGSSNGTYVNDVLIQVPTPVLPGDQITIGGTYLTLNLPGVAPVVHQAVPQGQLVPSGPTPSLAPQIPGPAVVPAVPSPSGGWRMWKRQPIAEGYVRHKSERYMVKKDDLWKKGCLAVAIGLLVAPFLAFLPFLTGNDIPAYDLRIEDAQSGQVIDVKVLGELMGNINLGDAIAVWGRYQKGLLLMESAFNYETSSEIRVKKV